MEDGDEICEARAYQQGWEDAHSRCEYDPPRGLGPLDPLVIAYDSGFRDGLQGPQL